MYVANVHLQLIAPSTVFGPIIMPRRKPNAELRPREYLTEAEVERLRKAACAGNRNGDETMILIALWAEAFEQFGIPKGHTGPAEEMFEP
jgi:hypothetical protein